MAAIGGKMCWKCGQTKTTTIYLGHFFHSDIEIACDLLFVLLMSPVFLLNRFSNFAMHSFIWHTCVCSEQLLFAIFFSYKLLLYVICCSYYLYASTRLGFLYYKRQLQKARQKLNGLPHSLTEPFKRNGL